MSAAAQPLAEVKVTKMKECPMLMVGRITPLIMQSCTLACKHYKKHSGKMDTEIVSYVAEGMFKPCLIAWYQADQSRIDDLTLDAYLLEFSQLVLERNWAHVGNSTGTANPHGSRVRVSAGTGTGHPSCTRDLPSTRRLQVSLQISALI